MYRFEDLEQLHLKLVEVEKALSAFSGYALYELDGGMVVWTKTKEVIKANLEAQKKLLRQIMTESQEISDEQRLIMKQWLSD